MQIITKVDPMTILKNKIFWKDIFLQIIFTGTKIKVTYLHEQNN